MYYDYQENNMQGITYFFVPWIDENAYNSYLNQNFLAIPNYHSFSYTNHYADFNGWVWENQTNLNLPQENTSSSMIISK
jgi:hypothetical protein